MSLRHLVEDLRGLVEAKKKAVPTPPKPEELVTKVLRFAECEHSGDLDAYIEDLVKCGATVVDSRVYEDEEECAVKFTVPKAQWAEFVTKFKQTDAYGFRA